MKYINIVSYDILYNQSFLSLFCYKVGLWGIWRMVTVIQNYRKLIIITHTIKKLNRKFKSFKGSLKQKDLQGQIWLKIPINQEMKAAFLWSLFFLGAGYKNILASVKIRSWKVKRDDMFCTQSPRKTSSLISDVRVTINKHGLSIDCCCWSKSVVRMLLH